MKRKTFDCVELQHRGGERVQAKIAGMTREEELAFWAERTEALRQRLLAIRAERERQSQTPASSRP
jgi:hypothetical protein